MTRAVRRGPRRDPWRSLLVAALVVFITAAVSGCTIEMALETKIEADGSGSVGVRLAADKEIQDLIAQQAGVEGDLFGDFQRDVPNGWEAESGTDADGTRWVTARRTFTDPAEFESFLQEGRDGGGPAGGLGDGDFSLTQERGFFAVTTVFEADWDPSTVMDEVGEEAPPDMDPSMLASVIRVENRLTLPGSLGDHNADVVEGDTLVWRPLASGVTKMYASSTAYKWPVILGVALGAAALIGGVGGLVLLLRRRGGGGVGGSSSPSDSTA